MRETRIFILRLLIDPEEPAVLRGVLQPIETDNVWHFGDVAALLLILNRVVSRAGMTDTSPSFSLDDESANDHRAGY